MAKEHRYEVHLRWTGNDGTGTSSYRAYRRDHEISAAGKPPVAASSDPAFRGDDTRYNPEELLVAALSSCHMLSFLHLCAINDLIVESYEDDPLGIMEETPDGGGRFVSVVLRPLIRYAGEPDLARASSLHEEAHHLCFIANSVNFPVTCEPRQ